MGSHDPKTHGIGFHCAYPWDAEKRDHLPGESLYQIQYEAAGQMIIKEIENETNTRKESDVGYIEYFDMDSQDAGRSNDQ